MTIVTYMISVLMSTSSGPYNTRLDLVNESQGHLLQDDKWKKLGWCEFDYLTFDPLCTTNTQGYVPIRYE